MPNFFCRSDRIDDDNGVPSSIQHVAGNQGGSYLWATVSNSSLTVCEPNLCQNNGHCQEVAVHEGVGGAAISETHCLCAFGYYGPFCTETDDQLTLKYAKPSSSEGNGRKVDKVLKHSDFDGNENGQIDESHDGSHRLQQGDMALVPVKSSVWNCYTHDPILHKGTVYIWWGHAEVDGAWACNSWISECGGSCHATSVYYIDNNDSRWTTSDLKRC